jgi:hypothetical protein
LGTKEPLSWRNDEKSGLLVQLPASLQDETNRPCRQAYAFKIEGETSASAGQ